MVLLEEFRVQEGQLHRILDGIDLAGEPANVCVVNVGHLLENEFFNLGLGDDFEDVATAGLHEE